MRISYFIPDDPKRSKVLALAEERRLPARQDGQWVVFDAVNDAEPLQAMLKAAGVPVSGRTH
ncbi:hypothetical protein [Geothrix sp. PMB-07]|uniref:hypothetical protein n=1 Tax=Geothrix sp. PMB-07 TaxID=3068640 RepID=UPI002741B941|nr:hypothetical protein [Geothrix sp. PMB-07]WLT31131.1 hypothetical protein Q9293_15550 [Geothrix sp. PMB-07]